MPLQLFVAQVNCQAGYFSVTDLEKDEFEQLLQRPLFALLHLFLML
jgi:hypothetical protein